jgi:hypothetical protein
MFCKSVALTAKSPHALLVSAMPKRGVLERGRSRLSDQPRRDWNPALPRNVYSYWDEEDLLHISCANNKINACPPCFGFTETGRVREGLEPTFQSTLAGLLKLMHTGEIPPYHGNSRDCPIKFTLGMLRDPPRLTTTFAVVVLFYILIRIPHRGMYNQQEHLGEVTFFTQILKPSPPALPLNCALLQIAWRVFRGRERIVRARNVPLQHP